MLHLLQSEWFIWSRSKTVKFSFGLATIGLILFPLFWIKISGTSYDRFGNLLDEAFSFPNVWLTCSFLNLFPVQLMSILLIVLTCRGFDEKTYRLHLLSGENRRDLWLRKVLLITLLTAFSLIITFSTAWLCGYLIDPNSVFMMSLFSFSGLGAFILQVAIYLSFALLISLLTKKTLIALLVYVVWFSLLERTISSLINHFSPEYSVGNFLPGKALEYLNPFELEALLTGRYQPYNFAYLFMSIIWLTVTNIYSLYIFKKSRF